MPSNTNLSYCQIMVGRAMAGLVGLGEAFEALATEHVPADAPGLGARLVAQTKQHNYVPRSAIPSYEMALLREYQEYLQAPDSPSAGRVWRDPRKEQKPWYPTIFAERCDGCGECLAVCPNNVLGWNPEHTAVLVLEPYECAPGCERCAKACTQKAIIMPPKALLHQRMETSSLEQNNPCATCSLGACDTCKEQRDE